MLRGLIRVFSKDVLDDRGEDALLIFGDPDVAHAREVAHSSLRAAGDQSTRRDRSLEPYGSAVRNTDSGVPQPLHDFDEPGQQRSQIDIEDLPLNRRDFSDRQCRGSMLLVPLKLPAGDQDIVKLLDVDIQTRHPQQESVEESSQSAVLRQTVTRPDKHQCGQFPSLSPATKASLVESHQQAVENRAVGVQQFVQKNEVRLRQHALGVRDQIAFAQLADVKRSEQLVRLGKASQQIVEHPPVELLRKCLDEGTLGRSGRAVQEEVLAHDQADSQQVDDLVLADEHRFERLEHSGIQPVDGCLSFLT